MLYDCYRNAGVLRKMLRCGRLRWRSRQNKRLSPLRSWVNLVPRLSSTRGKSLGTRLIVGPLFTTDLCVDSCERNQSTLCRKSWVFSGRSGFLPQGKLTGWIRIDIVGKVISQGLYSQSENYELKAPTTSRFLII
jgi:hypothetical protein